MLVWLVHRMSYPSCCVLVLLTALLAILFEGVLGHPGAVADGRATCGSEYSTPASAYVIPDLTEAWYLRRVATCEAPVFWTTFDVVQQGQQLYFAVISPEIERFEDNIQFHAILYGPGIAEDESNGLLAVPDNLPSSVEVAQDLGGLGYMKSPSNLNSCNFVDTNPVMSQFSDLIGGRCMEKFSYEVDYDDPLQQGLTVLSWWLYSFNHNAVQPGRYYLQTWLTTIDDESNVAQGKYEITLGPWTWFSYASEALLDLAQGQGTSCSCAVNGLDFREQNMNRMGNLDASYFLAQLPGGSCAASPQSACTTIDQMPYRSEGSAIEWSGLWSLEAGKTYEWTFRAYWKALNRTFGYPDPGMFVYAVESPDIESVASEADADLAAAVDLPPLVTVREGATITYGETHFIEFTDTTVATSTTVLFQPSKTTTVAVFTQHVPSEFMAHVLKDRDSDAYLFPTSLTLYTDTAATVPPESTEPSTPVASTMSVTPTDMPQTPSPIGTPQNPPPTSMPQTASKEPTTVESPTTEPPATDNASMSKLNFGGTLPWMMLVATAAFLRLL